MLLLASAALAAQVTLFTPEDLVVAHERGLPTETTARIAESAGLDEVGVVYLLRRGVPGPTIEAWGYPVPDTAFATASEAEMLGAPSTPEVFRVEAKAIDDAIEVQRSMLAPRVHDPAARRAHARRGEAGLATGVLMGVTGGMLVAFGVHGSADPAVSLGALVSDLTPLAASTCAPPFCGYGSAEAVDREPDVLLMGVGAALVVGGSVTFTFGADQLRLAGTSVNPWPQ